MLFIGEGGYEIAGSYYCWIVSGKGKNVFGYLKLTTTIDFINQNVPQPLSADVSSHDEGDMTPERYDISRTYLQIQSRTYHKHLSHQYGAGGKLFYGPSKGLKNLRRETREYHQTPTRSVIGCMLKRPCIKWTEVDYSHRCRDLGSIWEPPPPNSYGVLSKRKDKT